MPKPNLAVLLPEELYKKARIASAAEELPMRRWAANVIAQALGEDTVYVPIRKAE